MAVTKRAASTGAYESSTSLTSPHTTTTNDSITIDASDTLLVVFIVVGLQGGSSNSDLAVTAVTVGGANCTQWPGWKLIGAGGTNQDGIIDAWYLLTPAVTPGTGAKTVAVTSTFTPGSSDHIHTIQQTVAYTGTLDGSPIVTAVHNSQGSGTSMTASLVSMASGDLAVGMCANGSSRPGTTTGVEDGGQAATGLLGSGNVEISHNDGTGTVTIVWSTNNADESVYGAGRIIAGSAATVPGAPTALQTTPGSSQMGLSWTAPASDGGSALTDYTVQYRVHL